MLDSAALVAAGAVGGALARWRLSSAGGAWPPHAAVAAINVSGSFMLGLLAGRFGGPSSPAAPAAAAAAHARPRLLLLAGTGFLGAFTTFSTFSLDVVALAEQGRWLRAAGVAVGTPALGVGAAAAGLALGRRLLRRAAAAAAAAKG
jgi:CrcB protein